MPCFFKQSLEGRTCSARVQRCPDSCLIVFVCVCWNLIGWVARFAVLFTQVVNDYMRLASKSLIPCWVHPYAEGDTANVLCFSSLTHTIYETELGCPGMKERAFQKKKPSLESDILAVSRRLWDAAICCYLMLFDAIWCYMHVLMHCPVQLYLNNFQRSKKQAWFTESSLVYFCFSNVASEKAAKSIGHST